MALISVDLSGRWGTRGNLRLECINYVWQKRLYIINALRPLPATPSSYSCAFQLQLPLAAIAVRYLAAWADACDQLTL
jgi:hypothetical protein